LCFLAWREPAENSFMTLAERAAAPLLPDHFLGLAPRRQDAPGPFAFADRRRVAAILEQSGWTGIDIDPIDVPCSFPETQLDRYLTWMGPVGRILQGADGPIRARVLEHLRAAFDPYVRDGQVRFTAACWMIGSRVPPVQFLA
jgi:hypothetical protein